MPDLRAYCPAPAGAYVAAQVLSLDPDESHHLLVVHRAQVGDPVTAFDGHGRQALCEIAMAKKNAATLRILSVTQAPALRPRVSLAQAMPKGPAMDTIVRKATELGAAELFPLTTERTIVRLDDERSGRKEAKWRTDAIEAAKQCGNPWLPEIAPVQSMEFFLAQSSKFTLRLIASLEPEAPPLSSILSLSTAPHPAESRVVVLIGPEGDFTPAEYARARAAGFRPFTLGPLVLRSDTAATIALALVQQLTE